MKNQKAKILVVDDDASIQRILEIRLSMLGYEAITAADGKAALDILRNQAPDLIVLDIMLPKLDGYGVCQELRKESDVPIVMLTALGEVADRIVGLELGADDYVTKPFSPKELEARIRSLLRRVEKAGSSGMTNSGVVQVGTLQINTNKRQVHKNDELIPLTYTEFRLLELLVSHPGEAISRSEILEKIWGYTLEHRADMRVVDVHVFRLRASIEMDPRNPEFILTDRGIGYSFQRHRQVNAPVEIDAASQQLLAIQTA